MTDFTTHTIETAPEASRPFLEGAQAKMGMVPNIFANMAESPAMLEGYLSLAGIFGQTNLSEDERQIITMTNNRLNGCTYCMAAHTAISKGAGVDEGVLDSLRNNTPLADAKLEALRQFSIQMNESRGRVSQAQMQAMLDAGYTNETILEVVLGTALKVMSNYTNAVAGTSVDEAFSPFAWSDQSGQQAA